MVTMVGVRLLVVARVVVYREKGRMEGNTERTWEFQRAGL